MKHCPECNRNYADPTLSYCLDDGSALIFGNAIEEPDTAVLAGDLPSEAPTRSIGPHITPPTESKPFHVRLDGVSSPPGKIVWLLAGVALAAILAGGLGYRYLGSANAHQIESVAVLPFENGTGDPSLDYLSDGLSEGLIDRLTPLPQLKVISRNSSFKYRGPNVDVQEAAAKLGVRAVVSGKVTRVGDNLSIRVEMVDAQDDRQIWSEQFNRKAADVLGLQQEIAQAASEKLRLKLTGAQQAQLTENGTANPQAYELLLKGRYYRNKPIQEDVQKAIDYFEQAIATDPDYALAYAELADIYRITYNNSLLDPKEFAPKTEAAVAKAIELDPELADAYTVQGYLRLNAWDWAGAERAFKRAVELNANLGRAHDGYAEYLSLTGHHDEAIAEAKRARDLDPLFLRIHRNLGEKYLNARRFDEAIEALKKALELDPNYDGAHVYMGYAYAALGRYQDAIAEYERVRKGGGVLSPSNQIYLGAAFAGAGEVEKARVTLKQLLESGKYYSPAELAILYVALGEREQAFASLEKAYAARDLQLKYLTTEAGYDPIRTDPRFADLIRRVGLPQ
jgi:TolB-like protein/Flp pilus assembly protein TadD